MRYITVAVIILALPVCLSTGRAWGENDGAGAVARSGQGQVSLSYFDKQLAPHGTWVNVAPYGRVWQPSVTVSVGNWRPYVNDGHWRFTNAGWYWESTYPWGWAPFHYGRWNYHEKYKWIWQPDVTWAPAWVSWRHSDAVYGWAPLPFGSRFEGGVFVGVNIDLDEDRYSFVPAGSFLSINLGTAIYPRTRTKAYFTQTTVVKNSYVYNDNRVINNGIPVADVAKATKQEIKPLAIADAKSPTEKGDTKDGISVYRPTVKDDGTKTPPKEEATIPADHVTREPATDPKAKESGAKTEEGALEKKAPGEKKESPEPDAKGVREDPDPKDGPRVPAAKDDPTGDDQKIAPKEPATKDHRKDAGEKASAKTPDVPEVKGKQKGQEKKDGTKTPDAV